MPAATTEMREFQFEEISPRLLREREPIVVFLKDAGGGNDKVYNRTSGTFRLAVEVQRPFTE
jgi:hypothetical protein